MTIDVDLVIQADVDAALRLGKTLEDTPFAPLFADVEQVVTTAFILPLRHRRTGVRLGVAVGVSGFEQDAVRRAITVDVGGVPVPVAALEDLLVMKALAGRPRDDQDIRGLVAAGKATIDWGAARRWPMRPAPRCFATSRCRPIGIGPAAACRRCGMIER